MPQRPKWISLVSAGLAIAVLVALGFMYGLWHLAVGDPALRLESLRTGSSIAVAVGGLVMLTLLTRRQWHQEHTASTAEFDTTQRRITDSYVRAVDQLGHDAAAVRLGGLYALERLGQSHPEHRQMVINMICAYLRMPFDTAPLPERAAELQVRLTAQRILTEHLRHTENRQEFWAGMRLDLTGAVLFDLDLKDCEIGDIRLVAAHFYTNTFHEAAWCVDTIFRGTAYLRGATFHGPTTFSGARFESNAYFTDAVFEDRVDFSGCTFTQTVTFSGAKFANSEDLVNANIPTIEAVDELPTERRAS